MNKNSEYEKMPKNFRALNLDEKTLARLDKLKWVVTEKVHGANFSFVYENNKLLFAKRKDYLQWNDDFFGFQLVVNRMEENIISLFEQLSRETPAARYILYGELFGGAYPHAGVVPVPNVQAIQTGIYYSPGIHFCAFDIAVENESGDKKYMDYDKAIACFEQFGIFYAKPLFVGKLNDALNFNTRISSSVPSQLGLPQLETNLIEGVVVKPLSHSSLGDEQRPILKIKNAEFDEEKKFHEAEKWSFIPDVTSRSEQLTFLVEEMSAYINRNRLDSALSKTGNLDFSNEKRMNDIRNEMVQDILTDFNLNSSGMLSDLSVSEKEWIGNRVRAGVESFIQSVK